MALPTQGITGPYWTQSQTPAPQGVTPPIGRNRKGVYAPVFNYSDPLPSASLTCSLCGTNRTWGRFCRDTNQVICAVCVGNLVAGTPVTPPKLASFFSGSV